VQHLESVARSVQRISGIIVRETVPDWIMKRVREVVMADLTPEALQTRMRRGDIYPLDRAEKTLSTFFVPGT
jgi:two-component system sensor histidine kinase KdpD